MSATTDRAVLVAALAGSADILFLAPVHRQSFLALGRADRNDWSEPLRHLLAGGFRNRFEQVSARLLTV